jgi:hypothetical protein
MLPGTPFRRRSALGVAAVLATTAGTLLLLTNTQVQGLPQPAAVAIGFLRTAGISSLPVDWGPYLNQVTTQQTPYRDGGNAFAGIDCVTRLFMLLAANGNLEADVWFVDRVFQQAPEAAKPILPADLLAFFVGSAPVADTDLIDPQPSLRATLTVISGSKPDRFSSIKRGVRSR